ncbi:uncharacterized protein EI90DRAFT_1763277 [Cantharellus anzutake]|uniref:uncharacterized protein n=1 Tax=Cantharellus anzutake TaxID=1750568 RepID=UPI0019032E69|nr:uncharacterized protein EI90DRAFT_1763277 [Cantharellus anzutake]KAF8341650.1 hypothetical protein EI90DRAFT_1763277 [Cantharellus anzutake]
MSHMCSAARLPSHYNYRSALCRLCLYLVYFIHQPSMESCESRSFRLTPLSSQHFIPAAIIESRGGGPATKLITLSIPKASVPEDC